MIQTDTPFVLLDDARAQGAEAARLYANPIETLLAHDAAELEALLRRLKDAQGEGLHAAGFLGYGAGFALEPKLAGLREGRSETPLAWFGLFKGYESIEADAVPERLGDPAGAWMGKVTPQSSRSEYGAAFEAIERYIIDGDIYQANLTIRSTANYAGHPLALYAAIRSRAAAGYGGIVWTGSDWHLSFSPELFFALKDGRVTTKPMKGTTVRHADPVADAAAATELRADPKQRAENLMIVDLLRNDMSRVSEPGSVEVPHLFTVESYPTVHTMTSTVTAKLKPGLGAVDMIRAIFPCGSITGAPKIRAMEIIDAIEKAPRGIYCGSIGRIDASGDAAFNVAIRTFSLNESEKTLSLGLGSGLVADSMVSAEWDECLAKGVFARVMRPDFDLIETMRFEPDSGIARLELHLDRMKASGRALGFAFDRHEARNRLHAATFHLDRPVKIRLLAGRSGSLAIEVRDLPPVSGGPLSVKLVPLPVHPSDFRLMHKTSDRAFYDQARKASGVDEVIFTDPNGHLTEGSISAVFVERDGMLLTPPLKHGLLPSVLRRELIEAGQAVEADLLEADLSGDFFIGNSVRGLIPARRVA
jgi:para-aminobenzoate synthetase / 4-amino-4-deoxychorismate lyase